MTKRRKKRITHPYQHPLRYGDVEREAIETVRSAMSKVRGKQVSVSEAMRLMLVDKVSVADIEARARVMERTGALERTGPIEIPEEILDLLNQLHARLGQCQGSLNSMSKNLADALADDHVVFEATPEQIDAALDEVLQLRMWLAGFERSLLEGRPELPGFPEDDADDEPGLPEVA